MVLSVLLSSEPENHFAEVVSSSQPCCHQQLPDKSARTRVRVKHLTPPRKQESCATPPMRNNIVENPTVCNPCRRKSANSSSKMIAARFRAAIVSNSN